MWEGEGNLLQWEIPQRGTPSSPWRLFIYVGVVVGPIHMSQNARGGQKTACKSQFSLFTVWVLEIKLTQAAFTHGAIPPKLVLVFETEPHTV